MKGWFLFYCIYCRAKHVTSIKYLLILYLIRHYVAKYLIYKLSNVSRNWNAVGPLSCFMFVASTGGKMMDRSTGVTTMSSVKTNRGERSGSRRTVPHMTLSRQLYLRKVYWETWITWLCSSTLVRWVQFMNIGTHTQAMILIFIGHTFLHFARFLVFHFIMGWILHLRSAWIMLFQSAKCLFHRNL